MKACIILPTYNERENILPLLEAIFTSFRKTSHEMRILVVDDSSPDGTGEAVRSAMKKHPNLSILTGKKEGLVLRASGKTDPAAHCSS